MQTRMMPLLPNLAAFSLNTAWLQSKKEEDAQKTINERYNFLAVNLGPYFFPCATLIHQLSFYAYKHKHTHTHTHTHTLKACTRTRAHTHTHAHTHSFSLSLMGSPTVHCLLPAGGMVTSQNTAAFLNAHLQPAGTKHAENTARRRVRVCIMPGHTIFLSFPWLLT